MTNNSTQSLLSTFLKQSWSGFFIAFLGIGFGVVAICLLPDLSVQAKREPYEPFFVAAGALAAGIFVTLAVSSRDTTPDLWLGVTTVIFVGAAAVAAMVSLLPNACSAVYDVAFVVLVGGGLAGLLSTAVIAAVALLQVRVEHEAEVWARVLELRDSQRKGRGGGEAQGKEKNGEG